MWLARKAGAGIESFNLRLLWFGHPTNAQPLLEALPELREFASRVPLAIECVTAPGSDLEHRLRGFAGSAGLTLSLTPWSEEGMRNAFAACDAVLLPQSVGDPQRAMKSSNRLIDTINAGRFAICHPLPSYQPLADYAWLGESLTAGLTWFLRNPRLALKRIASGQAYVASRHSVQALAGFWMGLLRPRSLTTH